MMDHRLKSPVRRHFLRNFASLPFAIPTIGSLLGTSSLAVAAPQKMTPQELQAFGKQIQATANSQDAAKFRALFDWKSFIDRVLAEYEQNPAVKQAIQPVRKQLETAYTENNQGIDTEILAEVGNGADYRFLAMRKEQDQYKVIFRFLRPDWTLNYQALIVEKQQSGELKIIDIDSLSTGEHISQSLQRLYLPEIYKAHLTVKDKLNDQEKSRIINQKKRYDFLTPSEENTDPFQAYQQLPNEFKGEKTVLLFLAQDTIQKENPKKYQSVLGAYRKYHPNDPAAELLSVEYFALTEDYKQALESLDRLTAAIKTVDPYLYSVRAGILIEMGDINLAGKYAGKASEIEPDLLQPYLHLINISVMQKNFDDTIKHLDTLKTKFGFEYADLDLSELDNFEAFTASPQFKKWQAIQPPASPK
ncbi:tetratricopeptide repeat protein [Gimesia fumaroli]|uniref:Tetratricopeptide repeat protein n=1 Tax=Gimesia fumaroli TaxID=2527976 RepID=A0A518I874_9PLAN|nr:hypothetical protein [Gimesia fumaroli]QDV49298.1 hypothetical protein Enr17x_13150 [Gimesia fumaroli]